MPRRKTSRNLAAKPLTPKARKKVMRAIEENIWRTGDHPEDREPAEVIRKTYKGDADAYFRAMAIALGVRIKD